jgi:hypothetical protein
MKRRFRSIRLAWISLALLLIFPTGAKAITGGPTVPVNTATEASEGDAAIVADGSGGFTVAWASYESDSPNSMGVYFRRFSGSLQPLTEEIPANVTTAGDQGSPAITPVGGGNYVVAWTSNQPAGQDYDTYFRRFRADGEPLGDETRANADRAGYQLRPAIAPNGNGSFTIMWASHSGGGSTPFQIRAQRFDADGEGIGSELTLNGTAQQAPFSYPQVAPDGDNGFIVAWGTEEPETSSSSIYVRHFDSSGTPVGNVIRASPTPHAGQYPISPALTASTTGGFDVAWQLSGVGESQVLARRFDASGNALGSQIRIDAPPQYEAGAPSIAGDPGGGFTVVWQAMDPSQTYQQIYVRRFNAPGGPLNFVSPLGSPAFDSQQPQIVADGSGGFNIAWVERALPGLDIFLRNFISLPETTIDDGPPEPPELITDTTPTFAFSVDEPNSSFECRLDEEPFAACASPFTLAALPDGEHTFEVRAENANGVDESPASRSFFLDATAPGASIESGPSGPTMDTTPSFAFSTEDASASLECKLDFGAFSPCGSPLALGPLADGLHSFSVRATDPAGNVTPDAPVRLFTVDTTPPSLAFTQGPGEGSTINDPTPSFGFSAGEAAGFSCALDQEPGVPCGSPFTTAALSDGPHQLRVTATDQVGLSDEATRQFTIDTHPPETAIVSGPAELTNDATPSFAFGADEPSPGFECRLDGGAFSSCSSPLTLGGLPDGTHTFEVRATDQASNTDPSPAALQFTLDTTPPETSIDSPLEGPTRDPTPSFALGTNEPGSSFECALDGGAFSACSSPFAPALHDGTHTVQARALDRAGNVDPTPARRSITIDTRPPTVRLRAAKRQLAGRPIRLTVACDEDCVALGRGTISVRRSRFRLRPISAALAAGQPAHLRLKAGRTAQLRIGRLASKRRKALARITFTFTDRAGNSRVSSLRVIPR